MTSSNNKVSIHPDNSNNYKRGHHIISNRVLLLITGYLILGLVSTADVMTTCPEHCKYCCINPNGGRTCVDDILMCRFLTENKLDHFLIFLWIGLFVTIG
jgi:hypothetical protein